MASILNISKTKCHQFKTIDKREFNQCDNLFVITHLGQLKQMEALIKKKLIKNSCLVILYTNANFIVPQSVHDQLSEELFDKVFFLEIPFGINKRLFRNLKIIAKSYRKLLRLINPKATYLNSFEGHYAILINIARKMKNKIILVEEGTATYKFNIKKVKKKNNFIDSSFFKNLFQATLGKLKKPKTFRGYLKFLKSIIYQLYSFAKQFYFSQAVQEKIIYYFGSKLLNTFFTPCKNFDIAYVSFPNLIDQIFNIKQIEFFSLYAEISEKSKKNAKVIVEKYGITSNDVIFVSQRYPIEPFLYIEKIKIILTKTVKPSQRIFIKLHPKESKEVFNAFKLLEKKSNGQFLLINENEFLIEPIIYVSQVKEVFGITSTVLVYAPLILEKCKSVSIAKSLIEEIKLNSSHDKKTNITEIEQHLEILYIFKNIIFI